MLQEIHLQEDSYHNCTEGRVLNVVLELDNMPLYNAFNNQEVNYLNISLHIEL